MKNKVGRYFNSNRLLLVIFIFVLVWSGIHPKDGFTWALEVMPAIIGVIVLIVTYKKYKFTNLVYFLILVHSVILMIGGHYTYAEVPFFDWIRDCFHQSRNNYDKIGHLAQGFIPAMITREIFIRAKVVKSKKWMNFIIVTICMAISVTYELIEWFVAIFSGEEGDAFLGTQGYIWDTQSDMLYATIGAILALLTLSKMHDKVLQKIGLVE